jgi:ABC-2 type transport system permease protein
MYEITFPQGIIWGIMSCAAGFGIAMVTERTKGTLSRLTIAPVQRWHVLAGKALACFCTTTGVAAGLLIFAIIVFNVRPTSYAKLGVSIVMVSCCFVGVMMLLSVLGRTEQSAGGIGWAILMVCAMFGGGMIPLAFLPGWIQDIASFSPVKWGILAMEGAMWRSFSLQELLLPWGVLLGIGLLTFILGARLFRWSAGTA